MLRYEQQHLRVELKLTGKLVPQLVHAVQELKEDGTAVAMVR